MPQSHPADRLEAEALAAAQEHSTLPVDYFAGLSIAISLKRIADAMSGGFTPDQVALAVEHAKREGIIA